MHILDWVPSYPPQWIMARQGKVQFLTESIGR